MENNKTRKTEPVEPKFKPLTECLGCNNCKFKQHNMWYDKFYQKCPGLPEHSGECFKKYGALWILYLLITSIFIGIFFRKMYLETTSKDFFLSLFLTLVFAFVLDIACYFIEKAYQKLFTAIENNRKEKFKIQLKQYQLMIEEKKKKENPVSTKSQELEKIQSFKQSLLEVYVKLRKFDLPNTETCIEIKKEFKTMCRKLRNLLKMLTPEMLENISLRHFLTIHIEEFLKISNRFLEKKYYVNEEVEYLNLIKKVSKKIDSYIFQVQNETILDFNISVTALSKAIDSNDNINN